MHIADAKKVIESVLRKTIEPALLIGVEITEDTDMDGEAILNVRAIYDASRPVPRPDKMLTASVAVRLSLRLDGEQRFPLLAFVSSDDANGIAA